LRIISTKKSGIVILIVGLFINIVSGVVFLTQDTILNMKVVDVTNNTIYGLTKWFSILGVALIIIGAGIFRSQKTKLDRPGATRQTI
jgi:uncharacterized membrane protein